MAEVVHAQIADVDAADDDPPELRVVEACEQRGRRRLAGAGTADERHGAARRDLEREAVEDRASRLVAEDDVLERDVGGAALREPFGARRLDDGRLRLEHLGDPHRRGDRLLHRLDALAERAQGPDENREVQVEGCELAERELAVDHALRPEPERREDPEQRQIRHE